MLTLRKHSQVVAFIATWIIWVLKRKKFNFIAFIFLGKLITDETPQHINKLFLLNAPETKQKYKQWKQWKHSVVRWRQRRLSLKYHRLPEAEGFELRAWCKSDVGVVDRLNEHASNAKQLSVPQTARSPKIANFNFSQALIQMSAE